MPIQTWNSSGTLLFDSDTANAGALVGLFEIAANASATYTFPSLAGGTVDCTAPTGKFLTSATVDYTLGYPRVTVATADFKRYVAVWAKAPPTITPGTGVQAMNSSGSLVLSPDGFGLYFLSKTSTPYATVANGGILANGTTCGYYLYRVTSSVPVIAVAQLRTNGPTLVESVELVAANTWEIKVYSITFANDGTGFGVMTPPTMYFFARLTSAPASSPEFTIRDSSGNYCYDLMRSYNQLLSIHRQPTFASGSTSTAAISSTATALGALCQGGGWFSTGVPVSNGSVAYHMTQWVMGWSASGSSGNWTAINRNQLAYWKYQEDGNTSFDARTGLQPPIINLTGL